MVRENGFLALIDFGLAKKIEDAERDNRICGTLEYIPPQVF